ncbi:MAG: ABC transporter permease [Dehalococcoidales bacterium]|nr:ABC transporter permease [Dehalococcoidales bacterium]
MLGIPGEVLTIFSEETRRHIRSGGYILFTAAIPVLMIIAMWVVPLIMNAISEDESSGSITGEIKLERVGFTDFSGILSGVPEQEGLFRYDTFEEGIKAYKDKDIDTLYVIPENYLETGTVDQYAAFKPFWLGNPEAETAFRWLVLYPQLKIEEENTVSPELLAERAILEGQIAEQLSQANPDLPARIGEPAIYKNYQVEEDGSFSELAPTVQAIGEMIIPIVFAMLLTFAIMAGVGNIVTSISEEKENRIVELIITSASPFSIMTGKLLALGSIGLLQSLIWIIAAAFTIPEMFDQIPSAGELGISPGLMVTILGCYVAGYFLSTVIGILVGAVSSSTREASRTAPSINLVGFIPMWFMGFLIQSPDGFLIRLLSYIPFTAPSGILVRMGAGGSISGGEIAAALAGVVALGILFLWISGRVFRAAMLMQGQSFSPRNIISALRNAD